MSSTKKNILFLLIISALFAVFVVNYLQCRDFLIDDTYISLRYARNLVNGKGLVFNPGERVEGYTNFLWVLLLALFYQGGQVFVTLKIFSFLCGLFSLLLIYLLTNKLCHNKSLALLAVALTSANMYYVYHLAEGLETGLFSLLVLAAALLFIREEASGNDFPYSAVPLALTCLTRPDGLTLVAIFALLKFFRAIKEKRLRKTDLVWLAVTASVVLIHLGWRVSYYGEWWPNSYYAKKMGFHLLPKGWDTLKQLNVYIGLVWCSPFIMLALTEKKNRISHVLFFLIIISRLLFILFSGGSWVGIKGRFFVPAFPFFVILFLVGADRLSRALSHFSHNNRKWWRSFFLLLFIVLANYNIGNSYRESFKLMEFYTKGLKSAHISLGKWLKSNALPGETVAVQDAGALPYYSELPTIDILGLNDREIARLPGNYYQRSVDRYLFRVRPTYIVLISGDYYQMKPKTKVENEIFVNPEFAVNYYLINRHIFNQRYVLFLYKRRAKTN